jgi:hypothetical protein
MMSQSREFWEISSSLKAQLSIATCLEVDHIFLTSSEFSEPVISQGVEELPSPPPPDMPTQDLTRKRDSVMSLYFDLCAKIEADPLKPSSSILSKLLLFVEHSGRWRPLSIKYGSFVIDENRAKRYICRSVFCQLLRRGLNQLISKQCPGFGLSYALQRRIEQVGTSIVNRARMRGSLQVQSPRNPLLLCDIKRCVEAIPEVDGDKYRDASALLYLLYSFMMELGGSSLNFFFDRTTGSRSITFLSHTLQDIRSIRSTSTGTCIVVLTQRITKGARVFEHLVSIEGRLESHDLTDFVFVLGVYLKRSFGLDLLPALINERKFQELGRIRLWGYTTRDAWATRLNFRFTAVNYPKGFFSPHSTRSGFMVSAMVTSRACGGDVYLPAFQM